MPDVVTLENLKAVMRVTHTKEDALIEEYGRQASEYVYMRTTTWWGPPETVTARVPGNNTRTLPLHGYVTGVASVTESFENQTEVVDPSAYEVTSRYLFRPWGEWWCEAMYTVEFTQGLPVVDIPEDIIAAIKRVATAWYENRVPVQAGAVTALPTDVESVLQGRRYFRA